MRHTLLIVVPVAASLLNLSCSSHTDSPKAAAAAHAWVDNRVNESDLTRVRLTPEAEKRLGIEVKEPVDSNFAVRTAVAGEVVPIPGKSLIVNAPVSGTVSMVRPSLTPGQQLRDGEAVLRLTPLAGVQRDLRLTIEADVKAVKARLENATQQLARARQLLRDLAGSQRNVDVAEQEFGLAKAAHDAAVERLQQINTRPLDADVQLTVAAPAGGIVRQIQVAAGQIVAGGAPLFEVVDFSRVWVRVPVYAGDAATFQDLASVTVQSLDGEGSHRKAVRVPAPPTADPLAVTVDLYYELPNPDRQLRPGQRLNVHLPTPLKVRDSLQVPTSAILYDIHGGTWVYVAEPEHTYRRQRVEVMDTQGGFAFLTRGLARGARVVTVGAAELFGTEFGAGK
ncbi:MAG TPA: efflux RND transporter periplasmic adaptor subunit [Edaphobacter sp.]|nr:efflux RND transporter periplasmic adaptor subunit [Edaphobacter sp.]HTF69751.1 efflux RND transporter periplasmic adaptor subunit [Edaphobacter sp.]